MYRYLQGNTIKTTDNHQEWLNDFYSQPHLLDINTNKAEIDYKTDGNHLEIFLKDKNTNEVLKTIVTCENFKEYAEEDNSIKALHFATDTLLHLHIRYELDLEGLKDDIRQYFN